ncbi:MAG: ShlB/FhaC/HecB family hemolysin secretion/activation protein [Verrucomicrobiaceae bacterium]
MKTLLTFSLITAAYGLPVVIESGNEVPDREVLEEAVAQARDADGAADAILIHYHDRGFPAVGVEVVDERGRRRAVIEVARFGKVWLGEGPERTEKVAGEFFGELSGSPVDRKVLAGMLEDFHANPLHRVVPKLQPSEDGVRVNALLQIEQSEAQRFSAGYLDTGANPLPRERVWVRGEFADLFGRSTLTSAQVSSAFDPGEFHAVQLGTRFFQRGNQELGFDLSYSGASGFSVGGFDAYSWQAGVSWERGEAEWRGWERTTTAGFSYRKSNNALEFGAATARGLADVFQVRVGQEWERRDEGAETQVQADLIASPGGTSSAGDDAAHQSLRPGARAEYLMARAGLWHRRDLPKGWDAVVHAAGQWSSDPVLQADQIALGGASGLRGLPEQFALGDEGYFGGVEIRTPVLEVAGDWKVRPSVFLQAGETFNLVTGGSTSAVTSGLGIQVAGGEGLRASVHAGWRLDSGGSELHTQLTWKF